MVTQRTILQADTTFWVDNINGDDANPGTLPDAPKKTIQEMMNVLFREYDHGGVRVVVQLADSPSPYDGFSIRGSWTGHYGYPAIYGDHATFTLVGNIPDPSKVVIHGNGVNAVETVVGKSLHLDGLTITSDVNGIAALLPGSEVVVHHVNFGACGDTQIFAQATATIMMYNDINLVGGAAHFIYADEAAVVKNIANIKVSAVGPICFSDFFIGAARNGVVRVPTTTFSNAGGAVSGSRWAVARGGQIDVGGRNPNAVLLGNADGTVRIGGGFCG